MVWSIATMSAEGYLNTARELKIDVSKDSTARKLNAIEYEASDVFWASMKKIIDVVLRTKSDNLVGIWKAFHSDLTKDQDKFLKATEVMEDVTDESAEQLFAILSTAGGVYSPSSAFNWKYGGQDIRIKGRAAKEYGMGVLIEALSGYTEPEIRAKLLMLVGSLSTGEPIKQVYRKNPEGKTKEMMIVKRLQFSMNAALRKKYIQCNLTLAGARLTRVMTDMGVAAWGEMQIYPSYLTVSEGLVNEAEGGGDEETLKNTRAIRGMMYGAGVLMGGGNEESKKNFTPEGLAKITKEGAKTLFDDRDTFLSYLRDDG